MFVYDVHCFIDDPAVAAEWVAWMRAEHLADVCAAGASSAELLRFDGEGAAHFQTRYHFESRDAFERYERDEAPRLRAHGLGRFPLERGLRYERSTADVVASALASPR